MPEVVPVALLPKENTCNINEVLAKFSDVDRRLHREAAHEAEMVLVWVADQDGINFQLRDIDLRASSAERETDIEKNSGFPGCDLDAGTADFMVSLMDKNFHSNLNSGDGKTLLKFVPSEHIIGL